MKKINLKFLLISCLAVIVTLYACKKSFLDKTPLGTLDENTLANKASVDGLLIGAYAQLNGFSGAGGGFYSTPSNWVFAGVASDDAYKGSDAGDQSNEANPIETYTVTSSNTPIAQKWSAMYDGIGRCNSTLQFLAKATDLSDEERKNVTGQARFLRGVYHFELKKVFNKVPYIDETVTYLAGNYNVPNDKDIWPDIEADFKYAVDNLPAQQDQVGRANSWAAQAYLAKSYMFQKKFDEAKPLLDSLIASGTTSKGVKYDLVDKFADNFNAETENNKESIFQVQYSVNDGSSGGNSAWGDVLNFPYNNGSNDMPGGCCGFYQPTQNLVNSYRVDANGLPLFTTFNDVAVKNDQGLKSTDPFTPETAPLDPRLDWTVGRRGVPYYDWGKHPGQKWIRDQSNGGPYSPLKNVYYKSQQGKLTDASFWTNGVVASNYSLIRFADVLLWAAECEVEVASGSLDRAKDLVNRVRTRAANPAGWVQNSPENYKVGLYPSFPDQTYGRTAVRFERRLEFAMEGHRFFDLVRWGIAADVLNAYIAKEKNLRSYLKDAVFKAGHSEYFPIPQGEIDQSQGTLIQNP